MIPDRSAYPVRKSRLHDDRSDGALAAHGIPRATGDLADIALLDEAAEE